MPEATEQQNDVTMSSSLLGELDQLASPVPNLAATLITQAEQEAEDDNIRFLRADVTDDDDSSAYDEATESQRRMRRAVDAMVEPRVYTPAQLQELGELHDPSYADRSSRQGYEGWAPGTSDDDDELTQNRRSPPRSSVALLDEHVLRRDEHLRDRMRLRRLRDTQLEWRDQASSDPDMQRTTSDEQSHFSESGQSGVPTVTESSLRTTALLQAVRRSPQFSARSRNELQRYILERERGDDRDRAATVRQNDPGNPALSPSQRRQIHREATVRQEIQQHRDHAAEYQHHRNYLEEQLRQHRHGLMLGGDNRRRRYGQAPTSSESSGKRRVDEAIKYLGRLSLCESDQEGQQTAVEGGFNPQELPTQTRQDFLLNTQAVPPPPRSSWLKVGSVLSGTQHGAMPSSILPLRPPAQTSSSGTRSRNPHPGSAPQQNSSPIRSNLETLENYTPPSEEEEERWPVKVTIQSIDYATKTLSGTMEAFNVPDKSSPTKVSSIVTFLEGEIIDFNTFTLETKSFKSDARVDAMYWRKLPPFKDLSDDEKMVRKVLSRKWLETELMEKWILMRWKEKCFVTPSDAQTALTISGFYYVSLRRSDGCVEGLYYDPHSNPYQHLSLMPEKRTFPSYVFQ